MASMEFPAVSQSRIEFWKQPQFTREGMWWFTLFFGFFGLHHLFLRSPQTSLIFLIVNFLTLGYWWFYDLIQLSKEEYSGLGTDNLNKYGLSHPWGTLGLAKGMWKEAESFGVQSGGQSEQSDEPPNPLYFLMYSLFLPIAPLANFIAGDANNALSRFGFLTVVPGGFLLGFFAVLYDYFILFAKPADLLLFGTKRFFPFPQLGLDLDNHSRNITMNLDIPPCPRESLVTSGLRLAIPILSIVNPGLAQTVKATITTAVDTLESTKEKVEMGVKVATKVGKLATDIPIAVAKPLAKAVEIAANPLTLLEGKIPSIPSIPTIEQIATTQATKMIGGAMEGTKTPMDYVSMGVILCVIAAGSIKYFTKVINTKGKKDDIPPSK